MRLLPWESVLRPRRAIRPSGIGGCDSVRIERHHNWNSNLKPRHEIREAEEAFRPGPLSALGVDMAAIARAFEFGPPGK